MHSVPILKKAEEFNNFFATDYLLLHSDVEDAFKLFPLEPIFDLVVTSPPYNLGKEYETRRSLTDYMQWQERIVSQIIPRLKPTGSICWQVGNFVSSNEVIPLDLEFAPLFKKAGLKLRNRIIWHFGHGLHAQHRFSGRYEVVLWYTMTDEYTFNLDAVRVPSKYPSKKHFKGPKIGEFSGNPLGKNPTDVWDIPNVKANHVEKSNHPCQFPVGLIERLVLSTTNTGDLVFDPFVGVGSAGVAAAIHGRRFWGVDIVEDYLVTGAARISQALNGFPVYRPHNKPLYDPSTSKLSHVPSAWNSFVAASEI